LETFSNGSATKRTSISTIIDGLAQRDAKSVVRDTLDVAGYPMVTERTVEDIAIRLSDKFADRSERPLAKDMVGAIESYLNIAGAATGVARQLRKIGHSRAYAAAVDGFERRNAALEDLGLNPRRFHFNANFGRELEYYTGFVFQIECNVGNHDVAVAGGGRYDDLLKDLGAAWRIPAVGCAIHTERVKAVLE
jgi:ATP phosphoribosyltransferase regulatory subunit